ncbi:MAG: sulfatase-like hydrolase/transferase [Haliscomenobacter sp.]|nr:sulfatase-like hydrolase/transferase [Haliscomenobacter sp.]
MTFKKAVYLTLWMAIGALAPNSLTGQRPLNVVVFLVDDLGWQDTSFPFADSATALNRRFRTPNMERLARMGTAFPNAYATPVCTPSRVSFLTGANVVRHHVTNWTNVLPDTHTDYPDSLLGQVDWNLNGLDPSGRQHRAFHATPLPQLLRDAGYYTILAGKAHFGPYTTPGSDPLNLGFMVNIAGTAAGHPGSYLPEKRYRANAQDTLRGVRGLDAYHSKGDFLTEALTREALSALAVPVASRKPFFLYLSHYAVHTPLERDSRFVQPYLDQGLPPAEANYAALIEGMDKSLGDVLDYLESKGLLQETAVLFLSDNGGLSLAPPRAQPMHTHNLPLRMGKGSVYEGGIRVPLLAYAPGLSQPGGKCRRLVAAEDLFPTVLELAGIRRPKTIQEVDGRSFAPISFSLPTRRQTSACSSGTTRITGPTSTSRASPGAAPSGKGTGSWSISTKPSNASCTNSPETLENKTTCWKPTLEKPCAWPNCSATSWSGITRPGR